MRFVFRKPATLPSARQPSLNSTFVVLLAMTAFVSSEVHAQATCEDVSGAWAIDLTLPGAEPQQVTVTLEQTECAVTGLVKGNNETPVDDGTVDGSTFTFTTTIQGNGQTFVFAWEGTVDGDDVSGTLNADVMGSIEFAGKRVE